jgi:peptidoglycan/xylan/chitin deacetylase (PgdA/CDA1 family)
MTNDRMPVILMYHSITPYQDDPYNITIHPERFDQQMRWLSKRGRRGTSVRALLEAWRQGAAQDLVGLSFDDGYADMADYALPILQRYGFTGTVFGLAGRLGGDNAWDPEGPRKALLTVEQLRQLAAAGLEIGSHGLHHVSLPTVEDEQLASELNESRRILQEISGQDVAGFCYPWGDVDERAVNGVQAAGYHYGCAVQRTDFIGNYAFPRFNVTDADSSYHLWRRGLRYWFRWEYEGPGSNMLVKAAKWRRSLIN